MPGKVGYPMAMATSEILGLRDELLEKEKELSGMQSLLLEQDDDIHACQQRLGVLEASLLLACTPSSTSSNTGDEDLCPHVPASPHHPVQRTLYESAATEAAAMGDAAEEKQSHGRDAIAAVAPVAARELSPNSSDGGAKTTTPGTAEERRPAEEEPPQIDIYGRRLDRSFQMRKQAKEPIDDNACNTFGAYVGSGDDQLTCVDGCAIGAGRVVRAERRAEAAEAAAQEAAAVAAAAAREARAAIDETERLRAEGVDLSRWREAVVNLRDALETAQRGARGEGDDGSEQRKKNEDDPKARHAKWISSPALETLLPRLHENAHDLLAELAAARGDEASTATASPHAVDITGVDNRGHGENTPSVATMDIPLDVVRSSRNAGNEEEPAASVDQATAGNLVKHDDPEKESQRKECKTLQIVIHALREKDEESQKRIFELEGEVFQASLGAVKQEALISSLRKQLGLKRSRDASGQQPQLMTIRHAGLAAERQDYALPRQGLSRRLSHLRGALSKETSPPPSGYLSSPRQNNAGTAVPKPGDVSPGRSCCHCRSATPLVTTPADRNSLRDRRQDGADGSGDDGSGDGNSRVENTHGISVDEDTRLHPPTPTTDILRRLLYENTPKSATSVAESSEKTRRVAGEEDGDPSEHTDTPKSATSVAESSEKTRRVAGEEDGDPSEHTARRSRNGRRLFAEGSTVLRACPAASGDLVEARRGPAALFSDAACRTDGVASVAWTGGGRDRLAEREEVDNVARKSVLLGEVQAHVGKAGSDGAVDEKGGQLATTEMVLRERLLQAREEFSALRTGALIDSS